MAPTFTTKLRLASGEALPLAKTGLPQAFTNVHGLIMMDNALSKLQRQALEEAAAEAARWECIAAMGIFGSVARGDQTSTSDIDIAIEYVPNWIQISDFRLWQPRAQEWAREASQRLGRLVRVAGLHPRDDTDHEAYKAYKAACNNPIYRLDKAKIVPTKKHKP